VCWDAVSAKSLDFSAVLLTDLRAAQTDAVLDPKLLIPCSVCSDFIAVRIVSLTFGTGVLHLIQINHQPDATVFSLLS